MPWKYTVRYQELSVLVSVERSTIKRNCWCSEQNVKFEFDISNMCNLKQSNVKSLTGRVIEWMILTMMEQKSISFGKNNHYTQKLITKKKSMSIKYWCTFSTIIRSLSNRNISFQIRKKKLLRCFFIANN